MLPFWFLVNLIIQWGVRRVHQFAGSHYIFYVYQPAHYIQGHNVLSCSHITLLLEGLFWGFAFLLPNIVMLIMAVDAVSFTNFIEYIQSTLVLK